MILDIILYVMVTCLETDAFMAIVAYFDVLTVWEKPSASSKKGRYSRNSCRFEKIKRSKVVYLKIQIQWIPIYGKLENWDWTIRRDTPWNSQDAPGTKLNSGKEKAIWRHYPKWAKSLSVQFLMNNHLRKPHNKQIVTSKVAWKLARKYASSKPKITSFFFFCEGARHTEDCICCGFGSFNAQHSAKENSAQTQWTLWDGPKTPCATYRDQDSANKLVSTSFCSWSRSVRNSAITRWNASDSVAS